MKLTQHAVTDPLMRMRDACAMFDLTPPTVRKYIAAGTFPEPLKIGMGPKPRIVWRKSTLEKFREELTQKSEVRPAAPAREYSIEAVSVMTGLPMRTWRRVAGSAGFPAYHAGAVNGFVGPVFDADEIDAWRQRRALELVDYPSRFECGPFPSAERAEAAARRLNVYSIGATAVQQKSGAHLVVIPILEGAAPDQEREKLRELFPAVNFRLYDFGYEQPVDSLTG